MQLVIVDGPLNLVHILHVDGTVFDFKVHQRLVVLQGTDQTLGS